MVPAPDMMKSHGEEIIEELLLGLFAGLCQKTENNEEDSLRETSDFLLRKNNLVRSALVIP